MKHWLGGRKKMAKLDWALRTNENGQLCVQILDESGFFSLFIPFTMYETIYTRAVELLANQKCDNCGDDVVEKS